MVASDRLSRVDLIPSAHPGGYSAVSSVIGRMEGELKMGGEPARRFEQVRRRLLMQRR